MTITPEQLTYLWVAIFGLFGTVLVAIISGYFMLRGIEKRAPSQNFLEEMQGRKIAQEIIDKYEKGQLEDREKITELQGQVNHLTQILEGTEFKHITTTTSIIRLAKNPRVISTDVGVELVPTSPGTVAGK